MVSSSSLDGLGIALVQNLAAGGLYAVVDGIHFPDIRRDLTLLEIESRALYLDETDAAAIVAGPLLVPVRSIAVAETIRAMTDHVPAVVWWCWPAGSPEGDQAMWRHLRGLNMVEIPGAEDKGWDQVLLRHADPNVLAGLLALLDPSQVARFYGPALQITFVAPEPDNQSAGLYDLARPPDLPTPKTGLLRIEPEQYAQLGIGRKAALERRTYQYLVRNGGPYLASRSPADLAADTTRWLAEGQGLGLRSERALWKFAFVQLASNGAVGRDPQVVRFFADAIPSDPPDKRMDRLIKHAIAQLGAV